MVNVMCLIVLFNRYASKNFATKFQKVLNDAAKIFGVRVMAVAVRDGSKGRKVVTMYVM